VRWALVALLALAAALPAASRDYGEQALTPRLEGAALVEALRGGGYVILLRHMATEPVAPDPGLFDVRDCATQRNLSDQGRKQAERLGRSFQKLGIRVSGVLSSPYCRCLETARLAFGKVEESEVLSTADGLTVPEKSERGGQVRELLATPPPAGTNTVLITHTGTLLYSFGLRTRPEGVAHVFAPAGGQARYVGALDPDAWPALAGLE
jgi:phosphohistidine phosphatase SixA